MWHFTTHSLGCETLAKQFSRKIRLLRQTPGYVLIRELWPDGLTTAWYLVVSMKYKCYLLHRMPSTVLSL